MLSNTMQRVPLSAVHPPALAPAACRTQHRRTCAASAAAPAAAPLQVDVAIAGAGPAGLAAAVALRRADPSLTVHLFERTAMAARGAAVLVGVNGWKALEAIDPVLVEGMLEKAIRLEGSDRYSVEDGSQVDEMPMRNDEFKERYGYHNALLGWSDITGALLDALPAGSITPRTPVAGFEQLPGGGVVVLGDDGTRLAEAKTLIGADGWFSRVRGQLKPDSAPAFKDVVVWRARIPRRTEWLPNVHRTRWWVPPAGVTCGSLLAVLIPVPGDEMVWQCHAPIELLREKGIAFEPSQQGGSSHSEQSDASDAPVAGGGSSGSGGGAASDGDTPKSRCLKAFAGYAGLAEFLSVVESTPGAQITQHGLYQTPPSEIPDTWGCDNITLIGDAVHCAYVDGTGMGLSLEDAAVLGWHVQQRGLTPEALRAYEAERARRARKVFEMGARHAEAMVKGVPQRELMVERAEILYGEAVFKPVGAAAAVA